jgi:hypothetical protein
MRASHEIQDKLHFSLHRFFHVCFFCVLGHHFLIVEGIVLGADGRRFFVLQKLVIPSHSGKSEQLTVCTVSRPCSKPPAKSGEPSHFEYGTSSAGW